MASSSRRTTGPASTPASRRARRGRGAGRGGFTLIELLVVVVIVGIVITLAAVSVNVRSPLDELVREGERLAGLMRLASREAVMRSRQLGLRVGSDGYAFVALDGEQWFRLEDEIFRARRLPESLSLELEVEDVPVVVAAPLPVQAAGGVPPTEEAPQVLLLSSGDITPFELALRHEATQSVVRLSSSWENGIVTETVSE